MTVAGTASAAATNVAIPTHQAGDLLMVFTRGTAAVPSKPVAAGTVPNWNIPQAAIANSIGLSSAWFVATAANHTTGAWTNATHICVLVLRPGAGRRLNVSANSTTGNANNTQTIVYPAITLSTLVGTSWGVRCGTRTTADSEVANAPTNWTNQIVQPASAGALMAVHTRSILTVNPTSDSVTTAGTNAASRAHTIEVTEQIIPQPMVSIA